MAKKIKQEETEVGGQKPCFTCGKSFPVTTNNRILYYKDIYNKTGVNYAYYKNDKGEISITKAQGFKPKKGQEYALVSEFGNVPDNNVVEVTE